MRLSHLCLPSCLFIFKLRLLPSYRNWELEVLSLLIFTGIPHCVELHFIVLLGYCVFFGFWFFFLQIGGLYQSCIGGLCQSCIEQVYWDYFFFSATFAHFVSLVSYFFAILIVFKLFHYYYICYGDL